MVPTLLGRVLLIMSIFTKEVLRLKPKSKLHRFGTLDGPRGCMCMPCTRITFHRRYDNVILDPAASSRTRGEHGTVFARGECKDGAHQRVVEFLSESSKKRSW